MKGRFQLKQCRQKLPNGLNQDFQMIDHPGAVLILPFITKTKIVLIKQFRPSLGKYIYELPCGTIDPQEKPLQCARRELIEETGFKAAHFSKLGNIYPAPGYTNEKIHMYKAWDLSVQLGLQDPDEIITTDIIRRSVLKQMISQQLIQDAKTICALVYCGIYK